MVYLMIYSLLGDVRLVSLRLITCRCDRAIMFVYGISIETISCEWLGSLIVCLQLL